MKPPNALVLKDTNRDLAATLARETGKLTAFIKARVRNAADAEDIVQEVFFEFVQAYRLSASIEQVSAWLLRVARNRIIDRFRKKRPISLGDSVEESNGDLNSLCLNIELPSPDGDPEAEFARRTILAALQQALEELPAPQRAVFLAHEIDGLSFESLSRRDGVPLNTLLSRKRYAVRYLRQRLQTVYDEWES